MGVRGRCRHEHEYCRKYFGLVAAHLHDSVLKHMPDEFQSVVRL